MAVVKTSLSVLLERYRDVLEAGYGPAIGCHDLGHAIRVARLAERIAAAERIDPTPCMLAALFHDIGYRQGQSGKRADHEVRSAAIVERALAGDFAIADIRTITAAVRARRFAKLTERKSSVGRVLDDADNLDALGLIGIARAYLWLGEYRPRFSGAPEIAVCESLAAHCEQKLDQIAVSMHTAAGRALAVERHSRLRAFMTDLRNELTEGDI